MKNALQGSQKGNLAFNLCEYLWRREIRKKSGDFFSTLLEDIAAVDWSKFFEPEEDCTQTSASADKRAREDEEEKENKTSKKFKRDAQICST